MSTKTKPASDERVIKIDGESFPVGRIKAVRGDYILDAVFGILAANPTLSEQIRRIREASVQALGRQPDMLEWLNFLGPEAWASFFRPHADRLAAVLALDESQLAEAADEDDLIDEWARKVRFGCDMAEKAHNLVTIVAVVMEIVSFASVSMVTGLGKQMATVAETVAAMTGTAVGTPATDSKPEQS